MTATAQGTALRCDAPGCTKPGTIAKDAWSFCPDHAGKDAAETAAATPSRPRPVPVPSTPTTTVPTKVAPPPTVPPQPLGGGIGQLLENASGHSNPRVRRLGEKVETTIDQLRALITDLAADEKRKQDAIRAKAEAKAEVERLQRELAQARAKLRPAKAKTTKTAPRSGDIAIAPQPCTSCGGPKTRPAGTNGRWPNQCQTCREKSA